MESTNAAFERREWLILNRAQRLRGQVAKVCRFRCVSLRIESAHCQSR